MKNNKFKYSIIRLIYYFCYYYIRYTVYLYFNNWAKNYNLFFFSHNIYHIGKSTKLMSSYCDQKFECLRYTYNMTYAIIINNIMIGYI